MFIIHTTAQGSTHMETYVIVNKGKVSIEENTIKNVLDNYQWRRIYHLIFGELMELDEELIKKHLLDQGQDVFEADLDGIISKNRI